jgi:phospholipase/carboxylesterase
MPLISMRNYVAVAPRATLAAASPNDGESAGPEFGYEWLQTPDHILLAEHRVFAAKAAAERRFHVASNRIFLAGFGGGGTMAMRLALNHPTVFAGAASFGGLFPTGYAPLGRLAEVRRLKLLLATCRDSAEYPPESVCEHLRLFHSAGLSVCLRQYPCGDELTTTMLADMDRWIMDQFITPSDAPLDAAATQRGD